MVWFAIYDVFLILNYDADISFLQFIEELVFLRRINLGHAWYLPAILGLYILIPFVASVLKTYDHKLFVFPLPIYTFYSLGCSTLNIVYRVYNPDLPLSNQFSLGFSGAYYGLYILYGYFISAGVFKKIPSLCVAIISASAFVSVVFLQIWSYQEGYEYNVWYNNLLLLAASMGIYELASRIRILYGYKIIKTISFYSFAVYLTHYILKELLADSVKSLAVSMPLKVALLWAICFAGGFAVSFLISKIPKAGKYILYMK